MKRVRCVTMTDVTILLLSILLLLYADGSKSLKTSDIRLHRLKGITNFKYLLALFL